ncbi:Protein Smg [compost metagenome]
MFAADFIKAVVRIRQYRRHLRPYLRYIESMFEVLVYVYENYWQGDACPELQQLGRKLTAVGFEAEEIQAALVWLDGLNLAAQGTQICLPPAEPQGLSHSLATSQDVQAQSLGSLRVYSVTEQEHLGAETLGFVSFLESSGVLPPHMREIVIDRAMAAPGDPVTLDDLKIIVLMVYWSFGQEPDALVLDELCDDTAQRLAH